MTCDPETGDDISISRFAIGREWAKLAVGQQSARYFNLVRPALDEPVGTITAKGADVTAASVVHPLEPRKFNLGELRALCGFPSDFTLIGDYEQCAERLGRAVPPIMMAQLAAVIRDQILNPTQEATVAAVEKLPYRVPSMEEIRAVPWNGLRAVSTFSGCGGSSLGYRMAGFQVVWASEFVPAAQDTYRANMSPGTVLDTRDIRDVTPEDLLAGAGLGVGDIDLFDGSPPCSSFSTAGKREAGWGKAKKYSDTAQRTDDLFYEYARLVRGCRPRVFVAENVSGLVKGTAKGYFIRIMQELRACGYQVKAKLLDAQWLGVPQARQRLIFIGVRNDLGRQPVFPAPLPYRYTVRDALPHILSQGDNAGCGSGSMRPADVPSGTIGASPRTGNGRFPPSVVLIHIQGDRGAGNVTDQPCPTVTVGKGSSGDSINSCHYQVRHGPTGRTDPETGKGLTIRRTAGQDTSAFARRLSLSELRRICGFPDGTYEQRWERLGRAVPPVMMSHVAAAVRGLILTPARERA
jgi:DNA (cytosine-5)-methyltransferase 1